MWQRLTVLLRDLDLTPRWLDGYAQADVRRDAVAGLTVGVMLIPQGMAYAVIAGMPPIYGLYAALVPLLVYPLLGTSRQLSVGPVAIDMLIVGAGVGALAAAESPRYVALAVALAGMVGLLQMAMGAGRLGFVADFLSRPVIDGFTAAAALVIGFSQLGNLTGLSLARSEYVHRLLIDAAQHLGQTHVLTLSLGLGAVALILALRRWAPALPEALVVAAAGIAVTWGFDLASEGVAIIGSIPTGLPAPAFYDVSLGDLRALLPTALTLALVQFMSFISLGRVFATKRRYAIQANRELLAVGAANALGSLFRSMPVSGSFSRSAVNDQAGARSPLANVVAALLIGLTLLFLTPLFYYLPMPALAAIIIVAAAGLIDLKEIRMLFAIKRREGAVALVTFGCTLVLGIQEGILLGVGASMVALLYRFSRPQTAELGHLPGTRFFRDMQRYDDAHPVDGLLVLRVNAAVSFTNAERFKDFILKKNETCDHDVRVVILDGASINDLDTTGVEILGAIQDALNAEGIELHFTGIIGPVRDLMRRSGLREQFGSDHFHMSPYEATRQILGRWDEEDGTARLDAFLGATEGRRFSAPFEEEKTPLARGRR